MIPIFSSTCVLPSPSKLDISSKYLACLDFITLSYICVCMERNEKCSENNIVEIDKKGDERKLRKLDYIQTHILK